MVKKIMTLAMALSFASLLVVVPSALAKNGADDVVPQPQQIEQEKIAKNGADDVVPEPGQIEQEKVARRGDDVLPEPNPQIEQENVG